jgi:hypothetical protein
MPKFTIARLGIGAIVLAGLVFYCGKLWINSRTLQLVDMPVSLTRGYIESGNFKINADGIYSAQILFPSGSAPDCDELKTRTISTLGSLAVYRLTNEGSLARPAEELTTGPFLGVIKGKPETYDLKIEIVSDSGCLNALHPRLRVEASPSDYFRWSERFTYVCGTSLFIGTLGIVLFFLPTKQLGPRE